MRVLKSLLAPALLAVLLGGCGGSSRVESYAPTRLVAFGDELSLVNPNGSKYTVNALKADGVTLDCTTYPVWPQVVADGFGLVFPECNPSNVSITAAEMRAVAGAKADEIISTVDAYLVATSPTPSTLMTVMGGQNDILAAYATYDATAVADQPAVLAQLNAQLQATGERFGQMVSRAARNLEGARVLLALPPDLSFSPYASAESARTGSDRVSVLRALTGSFVAGVRSDRGFDNQGRGIGLVRGNEITGTLATAANQVTLGLTNITDAACTTELPTCTTATLVAGASGTTYLWADPKRLGPKYHSGLTQSVGTVALNLARSDF
jgi:outer membrane lipase/esterase